MTCKYGNCSGLTSVMIPNSVTSIGDEAFKNCSGLTSIIIGNSVNRIGRWAFNGCALRNVYISASPPYLPSNSFSSATLNHATLYVPYGTWVDYAYNEVWGNFIHIKEMTTSIDNLAPRRTYMLMNWGESSYAVYDPTSDEVKSLPSSNNVNEDDPNQCWQMTKVDGKTYLYNIGSKKFVKPSADGIGITLSDTPCPIAMENSEDGIMLGGQRKAQWTFVVNEDQGPNQDLNNVITNIKITAEPSQEKNSDVYDLFGRKLPCGNLPSGIYYIGSKKVVVK